MVVFFDETPFVAVDNTTASVENATDMIVGKKRMILCI